MKRALSLLLAVALCFSLTACGNGKSGEIDSGDTVTTGLAVKTEQMVSVREFYPFGEKCLVDGVIRLGNNLLICGENESSEPILGLVGYTVDRDGTICFSETKMLALDEPDAVDENNVYGIFAGGDGFFYVLTGEPFKTYKNPNFEVGNGESLFAENPDYQGRYSVLQYSENGEFLERIKIQDWPYSSIEGIAVGNEGEIVLYSAGHISLVNRNGTELHTEAAGDGLYIQSVSNSDQGLIVSMHETSKVQGSYYSIDSKSGFLTQLNRPGLDELYTLDTGNNAVTQGLDGEYVIFDSYAINKLDSEYRYRGLWAVNFEEEISNELYRLGTVGEPDNCAYISLLTGDAFVYTHADSAALYLATRGEQSQTISEGQSLVRVAYYGADGSAIQAQLDALNAAGGEYFYEYNAYGASQRDLLMTEISAGNALDLVLFSADVYNGEPLDTNSEYFEDLYPYLDADPKLSRGSFVPNLLEALSVDGRLTQLCQYVTIYSIIVRTSDVGDRKALTAEDYRHLLNEHSEYTSIQPIWMGDGGLLSWAATLSCSVFIDKESASCNFNSEEFGELLQWAKDANGIDYNYESDILPKANYAEYVSCLSQIGTPIRIPNDKTIFGEAVTYVGVPIGDEPGNIYYCGGTCMAIPVFADNKEGAWAFIRDQVSYETLYNAQIENQFPSIPVNLEAAKQLASKILTEEEVEELIGLMSITKYARNINDNALREIILTCGQAYLAGDKTLEDTVAQIQSRASVYMAEKYG